MASSAYRTNPIADREKLYTPPLQKEMLDVLEALIPYLPSEQDARTNATFHAGVASPFHQLALQIRNVILRAKAEMELGVAGPNPTAVNESSTRFSRPQRRRQAGGPQLHSRVKEKS